MNYGFSKRVQRLKPSGTAEVANAAKALKQQGVKVFDLGAGDPDFAPPKPVVEAAKRALDEGKTHYPHTWGDSALRQAIAQKYQREQGLIYDQDSQVLVTPGAKKGISLALSALLQDGDEVIVMRSFWTSYPDLVEMSDGAVVYFDQDNGFEHLEGVLAENPKIKAIILNSPSNPAGTVISLEQIKVLAEITQKWGLWAIVDEIYERIIFPPAVHYCLAKLFDPEKTAIVNGFSKTYAMTGFRLGYVLGPTAIIKAMADILSQDVGPCCSISQAAALAALTDPESEKAVKMMVAKYHQRYLEIILPFIKAAKLEFIEPQGAFYLLFQLPKKFGGDDKGFCRELLEKEHVALVPGSAFGKPGWVRLCFAAPDEDIKEGVQRILRFLRA